MTDIFRNCPTIRSLPRRLLLAAAAAVVMLLEFASAHAGARPPRDPNQILTMSLADHEWRIPRGHLASIGSTIKGDILIPEQGVFSLYFLWPDTAPRTPENTGKFNFPGGGDRVDMLVRGDDRPGMEREALRRLQLWAHVTTRSRRALERVDYDWSTAERQEDGSLIRRSPSDHQVSGTDMSDVVDVRRLEFDEQGNFRLFSNCGGGTPRRFYMPQCKAAIIHRNVFLTFGWRRDIATVPEMERAVRGFLDRLIITPIVR
jgi:hypothetical protein